MRDSVPSVPAGPAAVVWNARLRAGDWAPPLACFLLGEAVIAAASIHAGYGFPGPGDLRRGDAHNYLSIARHGYVLYSCTTHCPAGVPTGWEGNTAWFPLYSLLLAPFVHAGLPAGPVGAVVSAACLLGVLTLLWRGFLREQRAVAGVTALATAAVFPGAVYFYAIFPLSLLALTTVAAVYFARRDAWLPAGVCAALGAASYELGSIVPAVIGLWCLVLGSGTFRARALRAGAIWVAGLAVPGSIIAADRLMTGRWDAFLEVQAHFRSGLQDPLVALGSAKASTLGYFHDPTRISLAPSVQMIFVTTLVAAGLVVAALGRLDYDRPIAVLVGATWLFPFLAGAAFSFYRAEAALLPVVLLTRRLPALLQAVFLAVAVAIAFMVAVLFFERQIV